MLKLPHIIILLSFSFVPVKGEDRRGEVETHRHEERVKEEEATWSCLVHVELAGDQDL